MLSDTTARIAASAFVSSVDLMTREINHRPANRAAAIGLFPIAFTNAVSISGLSPLSAIAMGDTLRP